MVASVQDPRRGDSTTTLKGLLGGVALTLAASQDGSIPSQSFYLYLGAMTMSKWQDKTRCGNPVENVRWIDFDFGIWKWQGEVTHPDGSKFTLTWTEDGYHGSHRQPSDSDLVPLEAPAGVSADPDPRKALAEAAKAYKRAQDAVDAAVLANELASDAFGDAFEAFGKPDLAFVVNVDGEAFVFGEDGEFGPVEVL